MKKKVEICGQEIEVAVTANCLLTYKLAFGRDGFADMMRVRNFEKTGEIDIDFIYRFLWIFAKAANNDIDNFEKYFERFDVPPMDFINEAMPVVVSLLTSQNKTTVKPKKK